MQILGPCIAAFLFPATMRNTETAILPQEWLELDLAYLNKPWPKTIIY